VVVGLKTNQRRLADSSSWGRLANKTLFNLPYSWF